MTSVPKGYENAQSALCILPCSEWPVRVKVHPEIIEHFNENGTILRKRRVLLRYTILNQLTTWLKKLKINGYILRNEIVIPEKCLLLSACFPTINDKSSIEIPQSEDQAKGKICDLIEGQLFMWSHLQAFSYELIPCRVKHFGVPASESDKDRVVLIHCMRENFKYSINFRQPPEKGYERSVHEGELFEWHAVSEFMVASSQLSFEKAQVHGGQGEGWFLELVYHSCQNNSFVNDLSQESSVLQNNLPSCSPLPCISDLKISEFGNSFAKVNDIGNPSRALLPNRKEKLIGYRSGAARYCLRNNPYAVMRSGPDISKRSKRRSKRKLVTSSTQKLGKHETNDDSDDSIKPIDCSEVVHSNGINQHAGNDVELFGNCFAFAGAYKDCSVVGIEVGDLIVCIGNDSNEILGKVRTTGILPELNASEPFVGVRFEEKLDAPPFIVRHIYGDEETCLGECKVANRECHGMHVFIPLGLLQKSDSSKTFFRVLNERVPRQMKQVEKICIDYKGEAARKESFMNEPLLFDEGDEVALFGIEGHFNSCYLDTVLFSLFAFTNAFDAHIEENTSHSQSHCGSSGNGKNALMIAAARNILKFDIITPLRLQGRVEWQSVHKFRTALAKILKEKALEDEFMDAEELIQSLFGQVFRSKEFYDIGNGTKDYMLQLFRPKRFRWKFPNVQTLLEEFMRSVDVKFKSIPESGLIIKLPVSGGVRRFKKVFPSPVISLDNVLRTIKGKRENHDQLFLRAVICLKSSHFTCFVYCCNNNNNDHENGRWFFQDSLQTTDESSTKEVDYLQRRLKNLNNQYHTQGESILDMVDNEWINFLLENAYICIYEPVFYNDDNLKNGTKAVDPCASTSEDDDNER